MAARHKRVHTYLNRQKCTNCGLVTSKWSLLHNQYYCKNCSENIYSHNESKMNEEIIEQSNNDIVDNGLYTREQVEECVKTFRHKIQQLQQSVAEKRNSLKEERIKTKNLENRIKKMRVKFANDRWNVESMRKQLDETKILLENEQNKSLKLLERINAILSRKKIDKWSNNDILHWINSMNLDTEWNDKIMEEIRNCECNGKDIVQLKCAQEVGESFDIEENALLCNELFMKLKLLKNGSNINDIDEIKECDVEKENKFEINIFSQGKDITLNEKVTANHSIKYVQQMYKTQTNVAADIKDIHFYCRLKLLSPNKTLGQVNIIDERHLITVKFGIDGAII